MLQDLRRMDESEESETKRTRFAAAVSLDEPVDYEPLEGLTIDLLSKISTLSDAEELEGKRGALAMLAHYGVYQDVPADECQGLKELRARWEPQTRGSEVKWRYVAQEFKWMETRDDVFAASSTAQTSRMVDFVSIKEDGYGTFVADCVKAYYQADQLEEVCETPAGVLALAREAWQGQRREVEVAEDVTRPAHRWGRLDCDGKEEAGSRWL